MQESIALMKYLGIIVALSLIFTLLNEKVMHVKGDVRERLSVTIVVSILNILVTKVMMFCMGIHNSILVSIQASSLFLIKYVCVLLFVEVMYITILKVFKKNLCQAKPVKWITNLCAVEHIFLYIFAVICCLTMIWLCSLNDVWYDEFYSVAISKISLFDLIEKTANDVHPPLYYFILKGWCNVFGYSIYSMRFCSAIPWFVMAYYAVFKLARRYGDMCAAVFLLLNTFIMSSLTYNIQIRMYSWSALFIFMVNIQVYKVIQGNKKRDWYLLSLYAILSAYTLYWALVSVSLVYICLWIFVLSKRKEMLANLIQSSICSLVCYAPWLFKFLTSTGRVSNDWWLERTITIVDSLELITSGTLSLVYAIAFIACITYVIWVIKSMNDDEKLTIYIAMIAMIGTVLIGRIVSVVISPMWLERSLYPCIPSVWVIIAIVVSKLPQQTLKILMVSTLCITSFMNLTEFVEKKKEPQVVLDRTLEVFDHIVDGNEVIYIDGSYFESSDYISCYYPNANVVHANMDTLVIPNDSYETYIVTDYLLTSQQIERLENQGKQVVLKYEQYYIGATGINIYSLQ